MNYESWEHWEAEIPDQADPGYIPLRQDAKITCLYTLLPPQGAIPPEEPAGGTEGKGQGRPREEKAISMLVSLENGRAKIVKGNECIYIDNYEIVTAHSGGGYRLNTYKLLDYLIWRLDRANRQPGGKGKNKYKTPLCTKLTLPLDHYIRCCGYKGEIAASRRKDTQKELRKELRLLCATQIGWENGSAVRILDAGCVRRDQIVVVFSERMADHLLNRCFSMLFPLKLLHLSGKSLLLYSMGRFMAQRSSIISNQLKGTDRCFSVKELLKCCRSLPTPEEVRKRNGNYRQAIIRPFTNALGRLRNMEIAEVEYRNAKDEPETYDEFLKEHVEYIMIKMPEWY